MIRTEKSFVGLIDVVEDRQQEEAIHSLTTIMDATLETEYADIAYRLISPAIVYAHRRKKVAPGIRALWDTGSVSTGISQTLAAKLDLHEVRRKTCILSVGQMEAPVYRIDLVLWDDMKFKDIEVTEYPLKNHDCDILIGMDVISRGKLLIDSTDGRTKVYFSTSK